MINGNKCNLFTVLKENFENYDFYFTLTDNNDDEENENNNDRNLKIQQSISQKLNRLCLQNAPIDSISINRKMKRIGKENLSMIESNFAFSNLDSAVENVLQEVLWPVYSSGTQSIRNIRFVCPTNNMRDNVSLVVFKWRLKTEKNLFTLNGIALKNNLDLSDNTDIKEINSTLEKNIKEKEAIWSCDGIFKTIFEFQRIIAKKETYGISLRVTLSPLVILVRNFSLSRNLLCLLYTFALFNNNNNIFLQFFFRIFCKTFLFG
jgi:hypothetical protein